MKTTKKCGSIVSLFDNTAYVFMKHEDGCSGKHDCCPFKDSHVNAVMMKNFMITAHNRINAKVGDLVEISVSEKKLSGFAFLLFIFPLLMIFLGALVGYLISINSYQTNIFSITGGIFGFLLSLYIIRRIDKNPKNAFEITKIISK